MKFARENAKDIIALGFDVKKTFIYQVRYAVITRLHT